MTPQDRLKQLFNQGQQQQQDINPASSALQNIFSPATPTLPEVTQKPGYGGAIVSAIAPVAEFLSRPQYASAKFFDGLFEEGKSIFDLISDSFNELVDPKAKLSYSDIIKKRAPEFARNNPISTNVIGFLGDIALDPTTYLGVGLAGKGVKIGSKVATKFGLEVLERTEQNILGRAAITAIDSGLRADVAKAAQRGIASTIEEVAPSKIKKELDLLKTQFADEMQALGIPDIQSNIGGKFGKKPSTELAMKELGIAELPTDFTQIVNRKLSKAEVRQRAEERISSLADLDPTVANKIFEPSKLSLKVSIPFTGLEKEVLTITGLGPLQKSVEFLKALNNTVIDKQIPLVSQTAKALKAVGNAGTFAKETFEGLFIRPSDQPFKTAITEIENQFDYIEGQVARETKKMFTGLTKDRREELSKVMAEIDDQTRKIEFTEDRLITQSEADYIYNGVLGKSTLNPQERSIVAGLKQEYANAAALEMDSDLLKAEIKNYYPRYYDAIENPKDMTAIQRVRYGLSTQLTSSQKRKYNTLAEAIDAGLIPEMDAAMIYAVRVSSSRRALVKKQFFENLTEVFGFPIRNQNDLSKLSKVPGGSRYLDDIKLLGESVYPVGMNSSTKAFVNAIDAMTGVFKKAATVLKPSFAPKQAISNTSQIMLELGLKGAKTFDPRALADASMLLFDFYRGKPTSTLPQYVTNLFSKYFGKGGEKGADAVVASRLALSRIIGEERLLDVAQEFKLVNPFGTEFTGVELVQAMRENGVIRSTDSIGQTFKQGLKDYLEYDSNNKWTVTKELAQFWKFPSIVEDYGRATAFMGFVRQGYSFKQAANEVNKVLFDYQRGMTSFEKNVVRRVIPFYSFQRFAIPFVLKKMVESPGTVAASNKVANLLEKLLVSDQDNLTPSEREVFGDSLYVEQPRIFSGFDKEGKAKFNILNNMTPLDALSLFVYDNKTKELDLERTVQRTILAALTPFLKVPLEVALDKNFFTGRTISEGQRLGDLSSSISKILPDSVKDFIGWEDRVNMRTGKVSTYINPYFGYSMLSAVPALKQFITPLDKSKSILDAATEIITGVVPKNVDLKELKEWQAIGQASKIRELTAQIRTAKIRGADTEYERNLQDYREYLEVIKEGNKRKAESQVRGLGIAGQKVEQQQTEQENK